MEKVSVDLWSNERFPKPETTTTDKLAYNDDDNMDSHNSKSTFNKANQLHYGCLIVYIVQNLFKAILGSGWIFASSGWIFAGSGWIFAGSGWIFAATGSFSGVHLTSNNNCNITEQPT